MPPLSLLKEEKYYLPPRKSSSFSIYFFIGLNCIAYPMLGSTVGYGLTTGLCIYG